MYSLLKNNDPLSNWEQLVEEDENGATVRFTNIKRRVLNEGQVLILNQSNDHKAVNKALDLLMDGGQTAEWTSSLMKRMRKACPA